MIKWKRERERERDIDTLIMRHALIKLSLRFHIFVHYQMLSLHDDVAQKNRVVSLNSQVLQAPSIPIFSTKLTNRMSAPIHHEQTQCKQCAESECLGIDMDKSESLERDGSRKSVARQLNERAKYASKWGRIKSKKKSKQVSKAPFRKAHPDHVLCPSLPA